MSVEEDPVPPVPRTIEPIETKLSRKVFVIDWAQWFEQLRAKVNVLNTSLVNLASIVGTGFLVKDGAAWILRIFESSPNIEAINGDGTGGNSSFNLTQTGVISGTYGDSTHVPQITVDEFGRITDVVSVAISGGGVGTYEYWNPADKSAGANLPSGQVLSRGASSPAWARSVTSKNGGKWRIQFICLSISSQNGYGFTTAGALGTFLGETANAWALWGPYAGPVVRVYNNNIAGPTSAFTIVSGTIIDLLIDITLGQAWWRINGVVVSGNPVTGTGPMATFTPASTIFLTADAFYVGSSCQLVTNPADMTGIPVAGFTDGWPI